MADSDNGPSSNLGKTGIPVTWHNTKKMCFSRYPVADLKLKKIKGKVIHVTQDIYI